MTDVVLFGVVVVAFAVAMTVHVAIVFGLARRTPRWHAAVALVVAPLAPYWAFREKMQVRASLWIVALLAYAVARGLQHR